ncbi:protein kinase [Streptomyces sp. NBC_00377]|uniref:protein kinase domain-containing protein n=1 Tax=unclassified Streptomyces TaxID=2593676 RepID=UPI002E1F0254|nr:MULTISPECIES: protein kinase [unclassified Streptomyces]
MSDHLPPPPHSEGPADSASDEAAALRRTGAAPLRVGDPARVGPFVPVALLGSGGMGRVYLARAADNGPGLFAVKVIRPEYAEDVRFQRRFVHEAHVHARLGPPHAPRLRGTGWDDQLLWMATEYIPGLDLADVVREDGALPPATVWQLVTELGRALTALAAAEIVHRDLKPSNVLLSLRGAHVIDFGISKAADASAITGTGNRVGTPAYMSPEYLRTGHCDTASDVFSLAGTLLYAATGRAPFGDGTGVDVMHRVAFEEPNPEVTGVVAAADPELGALLTACLAKEPERRPTPGELIDAAGPRAGSSGWPEPLHGRVLARQRAYETLYRLPVERAVRLRPSDNRVKPVPAAPPGAGPGQAAPAPAAAVAASLGASPGADAASPTPPRPTAALPGAHRKRLLAVAAGAALCAVAAGFFVFSRPDGSVAGASPRPEAVTPTARSGRSMPPATPGAWDKASAAGSAGGRAEVSGDESAPPPGTAVPASASAGRPEATASAVVGSPPSDTPSPSADTAPSEPAAPAWITDCTYYAGKARTALGDTGKRVRQAQCMLVERGYAVGGSGVNGDFDADTETAVSSFQTDRGLAVNGVVNKATWAALRDTV